MDVPPATHPAPLQAHLLGPVRLAVGNRVIADHEWPRRSARMLLLLLLATPAHRLPRDRVLDLLWPDASPESALNALRVTLHALRRVLQPDLHTGRTSAYVAVTSSTVALRTESVQWIDVDAFEAALTQAKDADAEERLSLLQSALSLYTGPLLDDEPYVDWPVARREQLECVWRTATLELASIKTSNGQPLEAVAALEPLLAVDLTDEVVWRALMRAHAEAGEPDEALKLYERCAKVLRDEIEIEPSATTLALAAEIRSSLVPQSPFRQLNTTGRRHDNLPAPPSSLIGRERELETVQDLLLDPNVHLVTLTGPGGIGKSRLALEAARLAADDFPDGVCFVALAAIRDPQLVLPTITRTLEIDEVTDHPVVKVLGQALHERELLLVLDNFEQVIDAANDIGALLAACPHLTVLTTSREPLRLRAEHIVTTPPLAVPSVGRGDSLNQATASFVDRYDAVMLFAERARAARSGFTITDTNAPAVAALCARLDGLPLAIELAAARSRHLAPGDMLDRLVQQLPLLTAGPRDLPERHQTLWNTIAWSYDLLHPAEQSLFRRLAVFIGGFSLNAAEVISDAPSDALPDVDPSIWTLADKSLLEVDEDADGQLSRYRMLETIREFALVHLTASGEEEVVRRRHAAYFQALAEEAEPYLHGMDQVPWMDRLEIEHDNLRSALEWACERQESDTALGVSGALAEFWRTRGRLDEGRVWLERALILAGDAPSRRRALCLQGAGALAKAQGDSDQATAIFIRALDDWRVLGEERRSGQTLGLLAGIAAARGDYVEALDLNEQALRFFEALDDRTGIAGTLNQLGLIATDRGEYARARDLYERSKELYEDLGDRQGLARILNNLGVLGFWQEDYQQAVAMFESSLVHWRTLGDLPHTAVTLANLGEALRADGDLDQAMAIAREGLDLSRQIGDKRSAAMALFILGSLMQHHGHDPRAADPLVAGLLLYQQVGDRLGVAWCLEALAGQATASGRPELATQLLGAAEMLREQVDVPLQPAERPSYERHLNAARCAIANSSVFLQNWETGRLLSLDAVVALAAEMGSRTPAGTVSSEYPRM